LSAQEQTANKAQQNNKQNNQEKERLNTRGEFQVRGRGGRGGGPGRFLPGEKARDFKGTLIRLIQYLRPHWFGLIFITVATISATLLNVYAPRVTGQVTDKILEGLNLYGIGGVDLAGVSRILALLLSLYVGNSLLLYSQNWLMTGISQKIVRSLRSDISAKLAKLPLSYYDSQTHGELLSRAVNDVDTVSSNLQQSLNQLISAAVTLVGILFMMIRISPLMTLITFITVPLSILITRIITKRSQPLFISQQRLIGNMNSHVEEMFSGHSVIKAYGREQQSVKTFEKINTDLYDVSIRAQFLSGIIMPLLGFVGNLGYVAVCLVGGFLAVRGQISIGNIQSFLQYIRQFNQPINQTAQIANVLQSTVAAAERVFELLDEEEISPEVETNSLPEDLKGHVTLEHVRFGYRPGETIIHDFNLEVEPGQMIAIVGPTGAGKTTLVNLLMRFYEVDSGSIKLDGIDISTIPREELRDQFGMVLQDTWLYNDTIFANIAYGHEGATEEQVVNAAKAAFADYFIRTLPEGYQTVLNEEASNISEGQKQLLTIARAFVSEPKVLILDEATSSVDTRTELLIQSAMGRLLQGRTSFVIAHRLSTIKDADRILVLNKGDVIEQGNHEELLAQEGFYYDLYNSQFADQSIDEAVAERAKLRGETVEIPEKPKTEGAQRGQGRGRGRGQRPGFQPAGN
jgi:ATP-binding cassette subfamily B protein